MTAPLRGTLMICGGVAYLLWIWWTDKKGEHREWSVLDRERAAQGAAGASAAIIFGILTLMVHYGI
ncbi:hypothetical protein [Longimicrobium sp.]|jgi:hypothetical protein|uniref:hypothetical protein n=1 Tax=Longimicrobium sp. TaxID=2029185 RepID=UPI002EDA2C52